MATPTYDLLASTTLATAASSVTFSSINQTYGDLIFVCDYRGATTFSALWGEVNSDVGNNYNFVIAQGEGGNATSQALTNQDRFSFGNTPSTESQMSVIQFLDYSATNKHKSVLSRENRANDRVLMRASRWANTAAITQVRFNSSSNFAIGSTFNLYGIAK